MKPTSRPNDEAASASITKRFQELGDWRGETLARLRQLIHDADPDIQEEWKWVKPASPGTPVWSHDGIVCTGESYKQVVKLTFARGASIEDPDEALQFQPGRERAACDRPPRRREDQRTRLQATHPRRGGGQLRGARSRGSQEEVNPALETDRFSASRYCCKYLGFLGGPPPADHLPRRAAASSIAVRIASNRSFNSARHSAPACVNT